MFYYACVRESPLLQKRRNLGIAYPKVQVYVLMGTAGSYTVRTQKYIIIYTYGM